MIFAQKVLAPGPGTQSRATLFERRARRSWGCGQKKMNGGIQRGLVPGTEIRKKPTTTWLYLLKNDRRRAEYILKADTAGSSGHPGEF